MRIHALACDYDETIAPSGNIAEALLPELSRLRTLGFKLILVTGRELEDIRRRCHHLLSFDLVVAENGAVIFDPKTEKIELIAEGPTQSFLDLLKKKAIPFTVGHVIVSTRQPHEVNVLKAIEELGLELHLIFNKGAVMILPTSVNKALGLKAALKRLELSRHNVLAVGDAENDHSLLEYAGVGAAVANAVESLKVRADIVTKGEAAHGVEELLAMIADKTSSVHSIAPSRHSVSLHGGGTEAHIDPSLGSVLVMASKGKERDAMTHVLAKSLTRSGYQWCMLNFAESAPCIPSVGSSTLPARTVPFTLAEIESGLLDPFQSLLLNFHLEANSKEKSEIKTSLKALQDFAQKHGRPHYIFVNEPEQAIAHGISLADIVDTHFSPMIFITGAASLVYRSNLPHFNAILAAGQNGVEAMRQWCTDNDGCIEKFPELPRDGCSVLLWKAGRAEPEVFTIVDSEETTTKVKPSLDAPLEQSRQFCFRGPRGALSLSTPTIRQFLEMGAGVDEETWVYHLKKRDYSNWISRQLGLSDLAAAVEKLERTEKFIPGEARSQLGRIVTAYLAA